MDWYTNFFHVEFLYGDSAKDMHSYGYAPCLPAFQ
jgi:hypothetical protein